MTLARAVLCLALLVPAIARAGPVPLPLDAPDVTFLSSDRTSLTLQVHAGITGAPAGFEVQWLPLDSYEAFGGWPDASYTGDSRFSGIPTLYVTPGTPSYQLAGDQSVDVVIGKLFDETGVVADNTDELMDGTDYVVRVRAIATASLAASAYSPTSTGSTKPRTGTDCTVTLGYWKNHPEAWTSVVWARIGEVNYTNAQLRSILNQPAKGNGLISLAHQLISVKLNGYLGATPPPDVSAAMEQANAMIGSLVIPPIGSGRLAPASTSALTSTFDQFNTGTIGPGHCPDDLHIVPARTATWGELKAIYR